MLKNNLQFLLSTILIIVAFGLGVLYAGNKTAILGANEQEPATVNLEVSSRKIKIKSNEDGVRVLINGSQITDQEQKIIFD